MDLKKNVPLLSFNRSRILQVTINLVTNSIEACQEGGNIKIKTRKSKTGTVVFEVEDDGIGIKEENKEKIFNEFYTNKNSGTGLGLAVCKSIIEDQQAEIGYKSEYKSGSRFFIIFPEVLSEVTSDT